MMHCEDSSVLFITLDSCRYDTFERARAPIMRSVGPLHKAQAPSYFTFASHSAMFIGFTPGIASLEQRFLNPKFGKIFRLQPATFPGPPPGAFQLSGPNIIEGFRRSGYVTIGTAAVGWFDPRTETGMVLAGPFDHFFFPGDTYSLERQLRWIMKSLKAASGHPVFVFLNIGETHVPYYFNGAPWSRKDNPCVPFQKIDRAVDCRTRQASCVEYVDSHLAELLAIFSPATTILCGDHGDCWGEDGLWEHGVSHDMTLTVPLLLRVFGQPVAASTSE